MSFPPSARVLDVGGWFIPFLAATHVVDLMPYETRRGRLALVPEPGEHFTAATWHQTDFLAPGFQLPYADDEFDFVYCGQTLEDLTDPAPLLRELARVARAGRIVSPARLAEQTVGVRDRASRNPGHPHHHWILEASPAGLEFFPKAASVADRATLIPLRVYERLIHADELRANLDWSWSGSLRWRFHDDDAAATRARDFANALAIAPHDRRLDALWRAGRRARERLGARPVAAEAEWWQAMLDLSRPYNRLPS